MTPSEKSAWSRVGALESWANTPDRTARTAPARAAQDRKFETQVDPDGVVAPAERAKRADYARRAFYQRLALKSAVSRRKSRELAAEADVADAELAAGGDAA